VTRLLEATVAGLLRRALLDGLEAGSPPAARRRAVAALRLLTALATETRLRFDAALLRRLLPHLLKPLAVQCMCKVRSLQSASPSDVSAVHPQMLLSLCISCGAALRSLPRFGPFFCCLYTRKPWLCESFVKAADATLHVQAEGVEVVQEAAAACVATVIASTAEHCPGLGLVPPLNPSPGGVHLHYGVVAHAHRVLLVHTSWLDEPAGEPFGTTEVDHEYTLLAEEAGSIGPTAVSAQGPLQSGVPVEGPRFIAAARAFLRAVLSGVTRAVRCAVASGTAAVPEEVHSMVHGIDRSFWVAAPPVLATRAENSAASAIQNSMQWLVSCMAARYTSKLRCPLFRQATGQPRLFAGLQPG
jgi:hypothetical protein